MTLNKFNLTYVYPDFENLGVEYLMALSLKNGHEAKFIHYQAENTYVAKKKEKIPFKTIALRIVDTEPDLVCFSCVTDNYQYQLKLARALKRIRPKIKTIFGGIHPTAVPKLVLQELAVDAVAIGEAEVSFLQFLKNCKKKDNQFIFPEKKIKGIVFKKNSRSIGEFREGDLVDLNTLPLPHKNPFVQSLKELRFRYNVMTSRGCPYNCSYCFQATMSKMRGKRSIRQRSVENVINELLWAKKKYKFKVVYFIDDNFTTNKDWVLRFLKLYKRKIGLPFGCASHPSCMDNEIAKLLASAGCIFAQMGIQSLSPELSLQVINRAVNKEKIIEAIKDLKKAGMMVQVDHMLGIPGDTLRNQEEAVLFYNQHRPHLVSIFWLTYYPKTPIVQTALSRGILSIRDVKRIEQGKKLTKGTLHDGGSMRNPKPFYSIQFITNYLLFLPKWLVKQLIRTRWYRFLSIKNYYLSTVFPRVIQSLIDKRYFFGRNLIVSFFNS